MKNETKAMPKKTKSGLVLYPVFNRKGKVVYVSVPGRQS